MAIEDVVALYAHTPTEAVTIDASAVDTPLRINVDLGYDIVTATATLSYQSVPTGLDFRQTVVIDLGYDNTNQTVFTGYVYDDGRSYFPFDNEIKCVGFLSRAQYAYPSEVTYSSQTDQAIVDDLLSKVSITSRTILGASKTLGTVQAVTLRKSSAPWDLINEIDQVTGYKTFDAPTEVLRNRYAGSPDSASSVWDYVEGSNFFSIRRPKSVQSIHNKVVVTGLTLGDSTTVGATWQGSSSYVPTPPTYITMDFRSQLIESAGYASTVADRILQEQNRIPEVLEIEAPGNPILKPGDVVTVVSSSVGISSAQAFYVRHVSHDWGAGGFVSRITVEGGSLATGGSEVETVGDAATDISYPESGELPPTTLTSRPYATVVVAASNSTVSGASNADYVCDGTADEVTIEAAIAAATVSGRILLLEGTYYIDADIDVDVANMTIQGQGAGTIVQFSDGSSGTMKAFDVSVNHVTIADMVLDGNSANHTGIGIGVNAVSRAPLTVRNCVIQDFDTYGIYIDSCSGVLVDGCTIQTTATPIFGYDLTHSRIVNCYTSDATSLAGIVLSGGGSGYNNVVAGCTMLDNNPDGILVDDCPSTTVTGCTAYGNTDNGIYINAGSDSSAVVSCISRDNGNNGILVSAENVTVSACVVHDNDDAGITLSSADNSVVIGCSAHSNSTGAGDDANIGVTSTDDAAIIGNICRQGSNANKPDYGLEIVAGCNNIYVSANDLKNGGASGALNDAGTGTDTTSDNRTA